MINKSISEKQNKQDKKSGDKSDKPRDFSGVYISSHIKIFDPNTNEVLVKKRADD